MYCFNIQQINHLNWIAFLEPEDPQDQILVFPTMESLETTEQTTAATTTEQAGESEGSREALQEEADKGTEFTLEVHTDKPKIVEVKTPAPLPSRGDGPNNIPQVR